jgi:hypothetical protein
MYPLDSDRIGDSGAERSGADWTDKNEPHEGSLAEKLMAEKCSR